MLLGKFPHAGVQRVPVIFPGISVTGFSMSPVYSTMEIVGVGKERQDMLKSCWKMVTDLENCQTMLPPPVGMGPWGSVPITAYLGVGAI